MASSADELPYFRGASRPKHKDKQEEARAASLGEETQLSNGKAK